jgi:protein involved in polysaccharide export with SLBB domain
MNEFVRVLSVLALAAFVSATLPPAGAQETVTTTGPDTAADRAAPRPLETIEREQERKLNPFGANLFTGAFRSERESGLNPDYVVVPGDRVTVKIWGATTFAETLVVDSQGNIFIPEIGPVGVEGVRYDRLNDRVTAAVRGVFTQNVNVYTSLEGTLPVATYVTGYVNNPGSYAGVASDSILYFIDRAGGIDLQRGSFRDVRVLRDGKVIARADLYEFLLDGEIARVQFTDGDTVVVGRRGPTVSVDGDVLNAFEFEILQSPVPGSAVASMAHPRPDASHATLVGTRATGPVSAYVPLEELASLQIRDGDLVIIEADQRKDTMLVRVEGSHLGPSRFAVPVDTRLIDMLNHIEVDPNLADVRAVSLRRQSVARRQKQAIEASLRRLETATLGATSQTDTEASIRLQEAELIARFVERASQVEPEGVLVVSKAGKVEDVLLQPEDVISIPENSRVVLVSGEVVVPQAIVHTPGDSIYDYVAKAGGFSERAIENEFLVIRRNAEVLRGRDIDVSPGDEIVVLPKIPAKRLEIVKTIIQVIYQLALSTAVVLGIDN